VEYRGEEVVLLVLFPEGIPGEQQAMEKEQMTRLRLFIRF